MKSFNEFITEDIYVSPYVSRGRSGGRAKYTHTFPSDFQLVAATNPCPCGYYSDLEIPCTCLGTTRKKYIGKISGPILDRIDLHVHVRRQALAHTRSTSITSAHLSLKTIPQFAFDSSALHETSVRAQEQHLSIRSFIKLLRIGRTIANIDLSLDVKKPHLEEAWSFKSPSTF